MKKFIVAICGILFATGASASREPHQTDISGSNWNVGGQYSIDVSASDYSGFTPKYQLESRAGTFGETANGSIVAVVGRQIYENGAKFCTTQIQAGNNYYTLWVDYYDTEGYKCTPICKPGFYGNDCSETTHTKCDSETDFTKLFNQQQYDKRILTGKTKGNFTSEMDVFSYDEPGTAKEKTNVVLGVIKRLKHGVIVAPVKVTVRRNGNFTDVDTRVMYTRSNGSKILLCASGYVMNSAKNDCVPGPKCTSEQIENENLQWCSGYYETFFNPEEHKEEKEGNCKEYRCIADNYGFKSSSDHTCVACGTDAKSGIFNGVCKTCKSGQVFDKGASDGCRSAEHYSQKQMREGNNDSTNKKCWLESEPDSFCECVTGKVCSK